MSDDEQWFTLRCAFTNCEQLPSAERHRPIEGIGGRSQFSGTLACHPFTPATPPEPALNDSHSGYESPEPSAAMSVCHNCGHDDAHDRSRWMQCQHGECPCELRDKNAAEDGYRRGAEEALRRVRMQGADRGGTLGWQTAESIVERVGKEMGIE